MNKPLVSICIPTFNGGKYLKEALDSVLKQEYKNCEIIFSDDSSQDDTLKIIKDFKNKNNISVQLLHHKPRGIGANWNNCIKYANGEYIKFLFQDDVLFPDCISKLVKTIQENNSIGLVACKRQLILEQPRSREIKDWIDNYFDLQQDLKEISGKFLLTRSLFKENIFFKDPVNKIGEPSTVLFKKKLIKKVGLFREDLEQVLDYEFYFRILKYENIVILNEELVGFRLHKHQTTNVNREREIADYAAFDRILYDDFFWHLSYVEQKRLLFKFNAPYRKYRRLLYFIKNHFNSII
ncbi:glycosyltransferase [Antarcticibacterium sp. 1MA-6-2]|uniref:glycosyltransferase family 2 protein n=1 Tax=Antarcticibacterium sp. 1MA-6-2 TaxID=2908210 RepID=UPI001F433D64|nr:glycosyltransferase [Antarcticibacterium sp. 1MA-6-2]UJH92517.1 glycosyltransferase [Antarcticibacterium sp. 1MA-6-2]